MGEDMKGTVEIDDALFNVDSDKKEDEPRKRGRGNQKKQPVVLMVETAKGKDVKGRIGKIKAFSMDRLDSKSILEFEAMNLTETKFYKSDGYSIYRRLANLQNRS